MKLREDKHLHVPFVQPMKYLIHSNHGIAGGHQSLHQICSALTHTQKEACMIYPPVGHNSVVQLWKDIYDIDKFIHREDLLDEPDQVHIIPANWGPNWYQFDDNTPSCIKIKGTNPYKSKKVMYWLGIVPWQNWDIGGLDDDVNLHHPNIGKSYHACQSQHVYDFLTNSGVIDPRTIFMLRDYTHEFYFHTDYELYCMSHKRSNIILYNAAKGIQHTQKIIDLCKDLNCIFVKLQNLTREQIRDLGRKAKIYIDFGHHPGKDRIPREMASCGCIVITGNEGTALSDIDVPVGQRKFHNIDGQYDYVSIKDQIKMDLDNYLAGFLDEHQTRYRMNIRGEKNEVYSDVQNMVNVIQSNVL